MLVCLKPWTYTGVSQTIWGLEPRPLCWEHAWTTKNPLLPTWVIMPNLVAVAYTEVLKWEALEPRPIDLGVVAYPKIHKTLRPVVHKRFFRPTATNGILKTIGGHTTVKIKTVPQFYNQGRHCIKNTQKSITSFKSKLLKKIRILMKSLKSVWLTDDVAFQLSA